MNILIVDIYKNPAQFCLMKSSLDLIVPEECLKAEMKNVYIFKQKNLLRMVMQNSRDVFAMTVEEPQKDEDE